MDMETLTWCAIMSSCGSLTLIIVFNGILLCLLEHGHATAEIALPSDNGCRGATTNMLANMIETRWNAEKKKTVIGQDYVTKQFIDTCPKFLQNAYEEEYLLFTDKL
uniref:Uncharacterized protein n=1 Tax=Wuchereria bancrofti TaxID=6293 RepID=A0A1I8EIJ1_WUCBA